MNSQSSRQLHPAWKILLCCGMIYGSTCGILINCRGIYFTEAAAGLGVSRGTYATHLIVSGLVSAVSFPFTATLIRKVNIKRMMFALVTMFCAATALQGLVQNMLQCYMATTIQALASGLLTMYFLPYLVKNWFVQKQGFAIGCATMAAGVLAAIMNPVTQFAISSIGWRMTYIAAGLSIWIISAPASLMLIRFPDDIGRRAYGAESLPPSSGHSTAAPAAKSSLVIVVCLVFLSAIWAFSSSYPQQISGYSLSIGLSAAVGAAGASFSMAGNVGGKLVLGILNDRIGTLKTVLLTGILVISGLLSLCFAGHTTVLLYFGSFFVGLGMTLIAVEFPLFAGIVFKDRTEYAQKYTYFCSLNCLMSSLSAGIIATLYEKVGSYVYIFLAASVLIVFSMFLAVIIYKGSSRDTA